MAGLAWPFKALWSLTAFILQTGGRLLAVLLGIVLMIVGVVVSLTVIGAIIGIPLTLFGFALMMRGSVLNRIARKNVHFRQFDQFNIGQNGSVKVIMDKRLLKRHLSQLIILLSPMNNPVGS